MLSSYRPYYVDAVANKRFFYLAEVKVFIILRSPKINKILDLGCSC